MFSFGLGLYKYLPKKVLGPIGAVFGAFEIGSGVAEVFKQSKANAKVAG